MCQRKETRHDLTPFLSSCPSFVESEPTWLRLEREIKSVAEKFFWISIARRTKVTKHADENICTIPKPFLGQPVSSVQFSSEPARIPSVKTWIRSED